MACINQHAPASRIQPLIELMVTDGMVHACVSSALQPRLLQRAAFQPPRFRVVGTRKHGICVQQPPYCIINHPTAPSAYIT